MRGLLQESIQLKGSHITKKPIPVWGHSQKLETWNILQDLQTAMQAEEVLFHNPYITLNEVPGEFQGLPEICEFTVQQVEESLFHFTYIILNEGPGEFHGLPEIHKFVDQQV